ncbi:MAG: very short patch repair endonuclease [Flavobacteriales bacterium]
MADDRYQRDGRAPVPTDPRTSATMSRIRAKNTGPELMLRKALRTLGHSGYRLHVARLPARPDIAFVGRKVAVLVHGCFWHGCPYCRPTRPKSHQRFWSAKLKANQARDARKQRALETLGWTVLVCWECRIKADAAQEATRVSAVLAH